VSDNQGQIPESAAQIQAIENHRAEEKINAASYGDTKMFPKAVQ
jgi:hypothetical protein